MYPTKIEVNGNIYNLNTDFRVAIACFKAINDYEITDRERLLAVESLLIKEEIPRCDENQIVKKIGLYLRCGDEENTNEEEIDMDYVQDEVKVKTSIRQCYGINLNEVEYMHWWEYNELISGLTGDSLINKIRELRSMDVSEIQDEKLREQVIRNQERVALKKYIPKTEEEEKLDKLWDEILGGD